MAKGSDDPFAEEDDDEHDERDQWLEAAAYENFKKQVLAFADVTDQTEPVDPFLMKYRQIRAQKFDGVHSIDSFKTYKPVLMNNVISSNFEILPFGYCPPP